MRHKLCPSETWKGTQNKYVSFKGLDHLTSKIFSSHLSHLESSRVILVGLLASLVFQESCWVTLCHSGDKCNRANQLHFNSSVWLCSLIFLIWLNLADRQCVCLRPSVCVISSTAVCRHTSVTLGDLTFFKFGTSPTSHYQPGPVAIFTHYSGIRRNGISCCQQRSPSDGRHMCW